MHQGGRHGRPHGGKPLPLTKGAPPHPGPNPTHPRPQVFDSLATASRSAGSPAALRASVSNETVAGLFRDLRGVAAATSTRRTYGRKAVGMKVECCPAVALRVLWRT